MHLTKREARESGRDYAMRILRDNIVRLELEPGSMVSEKGLAAEMGLSRGPVREALLELSKVKIVEVYPQRGNVIAMIDYNLVEETCFMRETLESAVVERCCRWKMEPEQLAALMENVKLQRFYVENRDYGKLWDLDNEFHRRLFISANAMQIHTLMNSMLIHFDRVRSMLLTTVKDVKFVEDHFSIVDAIVAGDYETAKQLMHKHLNRYQVDKEAIRAHYPQYMK